MKIILIFLSTIDYSINSQVEFIYDSNIFAYSQKYLDEFIQRLHPERYPFETYDDLCIRSFFQLTLKRRQTAFALGLKGYNYLINNQKDYIILAIAIKQSHQRFSFKFEYLFLPGYLIRYYRNPEGMEYLGCEFNEHLFSSRMGFNSKRKIKLGINFSYEIDDYITNFDVYDSKAARTGISIGYLLSRLVDNTIRYKLKVSKAKGPVPDISYTQHEVEMDWGLNPGLFKFSRLDINYILRYRIYTTEVSPLIDSPHAGRLDIGQIFKLDWRLPIFYALYLSAGYSFEFRHSYSEVYEDIGEYKNYHKWMVNCGLEFKY